MRFLSEDTCQIDSKDFTGTFTFDRIFGTDTKQFEVFEYSLQSTVVDVMNGYNGTVFAYGQTGSGKSYTMMGPNIDEGETRGVVPRIVSQIFNMIEQSSSDIEYMVKVSYMEIYMERIKDLLFPQNDNLPIHEDKGRGVYVKGLTEKYVSSIQEVFSIMKQGDKIKSIASTNMNLESSRSHSIFMIVVSQKNVVTGSQKTGQLFLVDLAGSEKVNKTGASGQTLEEAKKINKSLSALGMVINALTDGKSSHIPYRDSKLTRILQESLGGNSRTSLIINCSPSSFNDAETLSTLRFGMRAKNIRNKAKINTELSSLELRQLLKRTQQTLDTHIVYEQKIESELLQWRTGAVPSKGEWVELCALTSQSTSTSSPVLTRNNSALSEPATPSTALPANNLKRGSVPTISSVKRNSVLMDYSLSPPSPTPTDSIDEYIQRENELQDQLAEKDSIIEKQEELLKNLQALKNQHDEASKRILEFERLNYEKKELQIKVTSLEEVIEDLRTNLETTKKELDLKTAQIEEEPANLVKQNDGVKKKRRMTEIMGGMLISETAVAAVLDLVNALDINHLDSGKQNLRNALANLPISSSPNDSAKYFKRLLQEGDRKFDEIANSIDISDDKRRLDELYARRLQVNDETIASLMNEIDRLCDESNNLRKTIDDLRENRGDSSGKTAGGDAETIQSMQIHISQFENMKKSLMRDLQDRCERIVELEILLDQAHDQYSLALKNGNNKQQEKKVSLLQRNLEQLTQVQRKLMEQNSSLKKEVAMSQRLLESRNERIQYLEESLLASQAKLVKEQEEFDDKLTFLRERFNEVRTSHQTQGVPIASMGLKIVKPLRGGRGREVDSPTRGLWERINNYVNS